MNTIDMTPTWTGIIPAMIAIIKNPDASFESQKMVQEEFLKMAKLADSYVEHCKDQEGDS